MRHQATRAHLYGSDRPVTKQLEELRSADTDLEGRRVNRIHDSRRRECVREGTGLFVRVHGASNASWQRLGSPQTWAFVTANYVLFLALGMAHGKRVDSSVGSPPIQEETHGAYRREVPDDRDLAR